MKLRKSSSSSNSVEPRNSEKMVWFTYNKDLWLEQLIKISSSHEESLFVLTIFKSQVFHYLDTLRALETDKGVVS